MDFTFDFDKNSLEKLFNEKRKIQEAYLDVIETERLTLKKEPTPDFVSTEYSVWLKGSDVKIGTIVIIEDGEIWYKIKKNFRRNGYAKESVSKLIDISLQTSFYLTIKFSNKASRKLARRLGFKYSSWLSGTSSLIYTLKKEVST